MKPVKGFFVPGYLPTPSYDEISDAEHKLRLGLLRAVHNVALNPIDYTRGGEYVDWNVHLFYGANDETNWYVFQHAFFECVMSPDKITTPVYEYPHPVFSAVLSYLFDALKIEKRIRKDDNWKEYWYSSEGFDDLASEVAEAISSMTYKDAFPLIDGILDSRIDCLEGYRITVDPDMQFFQYDVEYNKYMNGVEDSFIKKYLAREKEALKEKKNRKKR